MSCNNNLYLVSRHVISPKENPSHPAVTSHLHFLLLGIYLFWKFLINGIILYVRLPRRLSSKESACQCKTCELNPWIGKIPWRRKWQLTPAFSPGKSHGQRSLVGSMGLQRVRQDWATEPAHCMWPFVLDMFHLASCFSGSSTLYCVSEPHQFLWMSNILLYENVTLCLSIHSLMDMW